MTSVVRVALLALATVAVTGCATGRDYAARDASSEPVTFEKDRAYMARVEHEARRRGVQVHWVNPPLVRTESASDD